MDAPMPLASTALALLVLACTAEAPDDAGADASSAADASGAEAGPDAGAPDGAAARDAATDAGGSDAGLADALVLARAGYPTSIAVDATHVYFATVAPAAVHRVPKAGGPNELLFEGESGRLVVIGAELFWSRRGSSCAALDGEVVALATSGGAPRAVATAEPCPSDLAAFGGALYWIRGDFGSAEIARWRPGGAVEPLASGSFHTAVATDGVDAFAFGSDTVLRVPLAGGAAEPVGSLRIHPPSALAIDATHVVWVTGHDPGMMARAPCGGGATQELVPLDALWIMQGVLVLDERHAYFTHEGVLGGPYGPGVARVALGGGPVERFADADRVFGLALDATHAYWSDYGRGLVLAAPR